MTMQVFYQQLVQAHGRPAGPLAPLARLMRVGLARVRLVAGAQEWVAW